MNTIEPRCANQNDDTADGRKDSEVPAKISIKRSGGPKMSERANRSGGPRTPRGKSISSKNSVRHNFFSRDIGSAYRLDPESKREYSRLRKRLFADWNPVGASEEIQVELILSHLVHYRSFLRFRRALVLAATTPNPDSAYEMWEHIIRWESSENMPEGEAEMMREDAEIEKRIKERTQGKIEVYEEIHDQIHRWKSEFPPVEHFDKLQRYENHILRHLYRAMSELERLIRMRLGEEVPPRMVVELHND